MSLKQYPKKGRPPGVFFRPTKEELEKLTAYGCSLGVTVSFLVAEMYREGFKQWSNGNFTPIPTAEAQRMFATSKTATGAI
jgi:phage gp16-like protein